jgi:hypothetical protein
MTGGRAAGALSATNIRKGWLGIIVLLGILSNCYAQDGGRVGCSATLDEKKFGKLRPAAKSYRVTVRWRPYAAGIEVLPAVSGSPSAVTQDWRPADAGWLALDYVANLYYQVTYGPNSGYTLWVMVADLGVESCTWR